MTEICHVVLWQFSVFCSNFSITLFVTTCQLHRVAYFIDSVQLLMQQKIAP